MEHTVGIVVEDTVGTRGGVRGVAGDGLRGGAGGGRHGGARGVTDTGELVRAAATVSRRTSGTAMEQSLQCVVQGRLCEGAPG